MLEMQKAGLLCGRQERVTTMSYKTQAAGKGAKAEILLFLFGFVLLALLAGCGEKNRIIRETPPTVYYGSVTDLSTAVAIAGAEVLVTNLYVVATTDSAGYYRFPSLGASLNLSCKASSYQTQSITIGSKPGDSLRVDFALTK